MKVQFNVGLGKTFTYFSTNLHKISQNNKVKTDFLKKSFGKFVKDKKLKSLLCKHMDAIGNLIFVPEKQPHKLQQNSKLNLW